MEDALQRLPLICNRINEIEKKNNKLNDQISKDWIEEITDPEFQLIDNLVNLLSNSLTSSTNKERIIHILRFFIFMSEDISVKTQLNEIEAFPSLLSQYLITSTKPQLTQDSFYMIGKLFVVQNFKAVIDFNFLTHIFNKLDSVEDDEILTNAIDILININSTYTNINDSLFLTVYNEHHNSRVLDEVLLRILNYETNKEKMYKILVCLTNIMDKKGKTVFYSSDLETFIDIALSKLESTYTEELKLFLIGVLQRITFYEEYYKGMYKINELTDLMEDYVANEEQSQAIKNNCQKVLDNLVKHLQEKLKEVEDGKEEYEENEEGEYD